jgi:hypothetical protein
MNCAAHDSARTIPLLVCASVATMDFFPTSMGARYTSNSQIRRTSMVPVRAPGI